MPQNIIRYSDIDFSFQLHPITNDIGVLVGSDAVNNSVKNLILTNFFEKPFHANIGSNVEKLLFNNVTSLTAIHLERLIREVLANYEPRVTVSDVIINPQPDKNNYFVTIVYYINNLSTPVTITMILEQMR